VGKKRKKGGVDPFSVGKKKKKKKKGKEGSTQFLPSSAPGERRDDYIAFERRERMNKKEEEIQPITSFLKSLRRRKRATVPKQGKA